MNNCVAVLLLAFAVDLLIGDPVYRLHPTRIIGRVVIFFERIFEKEGMFNVSGGSIFAILVVISAVFGYLSLRYVVAALSPLAGVLFDVFMLYSAMAFRDMLHHADLVYIKLKKEDMEGARQKVKMIVGRNTDILDKIGIAMATIESASENFVDGFVAVVFWYVAGVLCGYIYGVSQTLCGVLLAVVYRTVNTLDSMVGYKNTRYLYFGGLSAKLDDILSFIPARLSVIFICLGACFVKADCTSCLRTFKTDRLKHPSLNSAHAESAVSGSLYVKLGGETIYHDVSIDKPFIGQNYPFPNEEHIKETERLLFVSSVLVIFMFGIICEMFRLLFFRKGCL